MQITRRLKSFFQNVYIGKLEQKVHLFMIDIIIGRVMRKYTTSEHQLCKILSLLSSQQEQTYPEIQFDDKAISKTPVTMVSSKHRFPPPKRQTPSEYYNEHQLESKIGTTSKAFSPTLPKKTSENKSNSNSLSFTAGKTHSQVIRIRKFVAKQKQKNSPKRQIRWSLKVFSQQYPKKGRNTSSSLRKCLKDQDKQRSVIFNEKQVKIHFEEFEPWRYQEEIDFEDDINLIRKLSQR